MVVRKRIITILITFSFCFIILIGRLVQIQLVETESFSKHQVNLIEQSVEQRTHSLVINDGRGRILDRNGQLLTSNNAPSLVLFPFASQFPTQVKEVARILNISSHKLLNALEKADKPFIYSELDSDSLTEEMVSQINELNIPGIFAEYVETDILAPYGNHFIGVTRENPERIKSLHGEKLHKGLVSVKTKTGIRGVEKAFDPFLISEGESKLVYHVTRNGTPLFGLDVKYSAPSNPFYPVELKTTLDKEVQIIVEDAVNQMNIAEGGAVLLDIETRDVLGMVSRPMFTADEPLAEGTRNKVLESWEPGSIFKIVTAAAAIEENRIDSNRKFDCDLNVYGDGIDKDRPLGMLTFAESFAQSCNYTFATLATELMKDNDNMLTKYAKFLGLSNRVGWKGNVFHLEDFEHFPDEISGSIWSEGRGKSPRAIQQTAIGQLDVRLSPIAVANMMATIASAGEYKEVRAATEVLYKNGSTLAYFPEHESKEWQLSNFTYNKLQELLSEVVTSSNGTGKALNNLSYTVAGKSGTAELVDGDGKGPVNSWFAGYFPTESPKYALVVFELNHTGRQKVQDTFKQIVERLYQYDHH